MKYSSDDKIKAKSFYLIVAICLVAIVAISYLAVAKSNEKMGKSNNSSLNSDISSYNNSTDEIGTESATQQTEKEVSDIPYESKVESTKETTTEKKSFVMPIKGDIIKNYSDTALQYDSTYNDMRLHNGIDIACKENSQVVSASAGIVTEVTDTTDFGKVITIDHKDGLVTKYCGIDTSYVKQGEQVAISTLLGTVKNPPCECMDKCHIHIECYQDGKLCSPIEAFGFNN